MLKFFNKVRIHRITSHYKVELLRSFACSTHFQARMFKRIFTLLRLEHLQKTKTWRSKYDKEIVLAKKVIFKNIVVHFFRPVCQINFIISKWGYVNIFTMHTQTGRILVFQVFQGGFSIPVIKSECAYISETIP